MRHVGRPQTCRSIPRDTVLLARPVLRRRVACGPARAHPLCQFYVAASRVGLPAHIRFALAPGEDGVYRTANVVFREALTGA